MGTSSSKFRAHYCLNTFKCSLFFFSFFYFYCPVKPLDAFFFFTNISFDKLWFASGTLARSQTCFNSVAYGVIHKQYRHSYARCVIFVSCILCCSRSSSVARSPSQRPLGHHVTNQAPCDDVDRKQIL